MFNENIRKVEKKNNTNLKYFHDRVSTEAKNVCGVTTVKVGNRRKDTWW